MRIKYAAFAARLWQTLSDAQAFSLAALRVAILFATRVQSVFPRLREKPINLCREAGPFVLFGAPFNAVVHFKLGIEPYLRLNTEGSVGILNV